MKKNIWLIFLLGLSVNSLYAQKSSWTKDDDGKYTYYEVIADTGFVYDAMPEKVRRFVKERKLKIVSLNDSLSKASGSFLINKSSGAISHPAASVAYRLQIEWKKEKYRFWLSDFMLTTYERDRYGNFVPTKLSAKPLELDPGKLNRAQWNEYIAQVKSKAVIFAQNLKAYLAKAKPMPVSPDVKKQKDW